MTGTLQEKIIGFISGDSQTRYTEDFIGEIIDRRYVVVEKAPKATEVHHYQLYDMETFHRFEAKIIPLDGNKLLIQPLPLKPASPPPLREDKKEERDAPGEPMTRLLYNQPAEHPMFGSGQPQSQSFAHIGRAGTQRKRTPTGAVRFEAAWFALGAQLETREPTEEDLENIEPEQERLEQFADEITYNTLRQYSLGRSQASLLASKIPLNQFPQDAPTSWRRAISWLNENRKKSILLGSAFGVVMIILAFV